MAEAAVLQNLSHEVALAVTHFNASRYLSVAGFVVLVYDHLLTFADEVDLIWKNPTKPVACLFLFNRYVIPLVIIIDIFEKSGLARNLPDEFCVVWLFVEGFLQAICFGIAHILVALRVRALYVKRPWVEWVLWLSGTGYFAATVGIVFLALTTVAKGYAWNPMFHMCIGNIPHWTFWIWVPALVFETILFGLTAGKAIHHYRQNVSLPIARMLYRDGFLYFIIISLCCVFNIVAWAVLPETLIAIAKYFTFSFINVMSSRLVLNLHSLRRSDESTYWGHNTTTNPASMEMREWPVSPKSPKPFTAFPARVSYLKASQRRESNGSGRRPLRAPSPRSPGSATPNSASLFIRPFERSQASATRELGTMTPTDNKRPVPETDLGTVSFTSHRGGFSQTKAITPPPPLRVKVDVDVDFDIEIASGASSHIVGSHVNIIAVQLNINRA
ncbi:hypothetical protein FRC01_012236 [Tulasnella sp. 417]|nr:hypothetical protein FRC01_012236 [Tulasnella sp. 417]